MVFGDPSLQHY